MAGKDKTAYCRKVAQCEDAEQAGFSACAISNNYQLSVMAKSARIFLGLSFRLGFLFVSSSKSNGESPPA